MGDTLFGGVESGTPLETREGTSELARMFQSILRGDTSSIGNFQRLGAQSFSNLFGVTPGDAGTPDVISSLLRDPATQLEGLFESMRPFENRQINEAVAGTRAGFGTAGGRFSRNASDAEARVRGELGAQFGRNRENALLQAQQQRGNFLATLFGLANQNTQTAMQPLALASQFLAPGAPTYREGLLPGLIAAAGNVYAGSLAGGGGAPPTTGPGTFNPPPYRAGG